MDVELIGENGSLLQEIVTVNNSSTQRNQRGEKQNKKKSLWLYTLSGHCVCCWVLLPSYATACAQGPAVTRPPSVL